MFGRQFVARESAASNSDAGVCGFAMLLGGLIGLDREAARKPAGLRTHMLVSGAAALLVLLGARDGQKL
jgi:uncharacterized membrane protein YhiD involved in acid resistance